MQNFFEKNQKKLVRKAHKPTRDMESDYLTKVLQGKSFHAHLKTLNGIRWDQ